MKNKIFGGMAVLIITAVAMFNMNIGSKSSKLSDISLANVEALALDEDVVITCGRTGGQCWQDDGCDVEWTPFGPIYTTRCIFCGSMKYSCISGLPTNPC